jgi:hypothetical protein
MADKILSLYAKGITTREIVATFKEMYDTDVSASLNSKVTDSVLERVIEWQSQPLNDVCPIVYLDCIVLKIRQDKQVINKAIYSALGVNLEGHKELLGLWISENEGAKFWLRVLTELQNRGVKDILITCVDGLKGFPDAINAVYPETHIQLCIVHMVRNSIKYAPWKDYKPVTAALKRIYKSANEKEALLELDRFGEDWDDKYPQTSRSWRSNWENSNTIFNYPADIRKAIYTTNAIESLNSVIRKATSSIYLKKHAGKPSSNTVSKATFFIIFSLYTVVVLAIVSDSGIVALVNVGPSLVAITLYLVYCISSNEPSVSIYQQLIEVKNSPVAFRTFLKISDISSCTFLSDKIIFHYDEKRRLKLAHKFIDKNRLAELKANLSRLVAVEKEAIK